MYIVYYYKSFEYWILVYQFIEKHSGVSLSNLNI